MQTDASLGHIHKKINEIESALLRFVDNDIQPSLHVKIKCYGKNSIMCFPSEKVDVAKLRNNRVSLVQKSEKNYLYISGQIGTRSRGVEKALSIRVLRACWFILKSKGSVSWLQEKCIYDITEGSQLELAS